ncbi:MAG: Ig-like domain-containing protein [Bacilli bacterium]
MGKKIRKKKGFTLVELLGVVVVLSLVLLIAVPSVSNIIKNSKEKTFLKTQLSVEEAARNYYALNKDMVDFEESIAYIPLSDINNYIEDVRDPNGKKCTGRIKVIEGKNDTYTYKAELDCGEGYAVEEDITAPIISLNSSSTIYLWRGVDTFIETVSASDNIDGDLTNMIETTITKVDTNTVVPSIDNTKNDTYRIEYRVADSSGNTAKKYREVVVREDIEGPLVVIVNETTGVKANHSVKVMITDDNDFVKYYQWTTSKTTPSSSDSNWISYNYDSEITGSGSLVFGKTGNYYLHIKAVDSEGNLTLVTDDSYLAFDNTNLDVVLAVDNTNIAKSHTVNITINKEAISEKHYKWSNSPDVPTSGWAKLNTNQLTLTGINGDWYLHVKIKDQVGTETVATSAKMTLDNIKPIINIALDNYDYKSSHTATVTITDLYFNTGKTYYIYDENRNNPASNDLAWTLYTGNTIVESGISGNYYLHIKAVDDAGNENISTSTLVRFDNIKPTLSLTSSSTGCSSVVITATGSDTGGSGFYRIKRPNNTYISSTVATYTVSTNGTYSFTGYDNAGNSYTKSIVVDGIDVIAPAKPGEPDLVASSDTGYSNSDNITKNTNVTVSGSNAEAGTTYYVYSGSTEKASGTVASNGTWSTTISLSANTTNNISVKLKDACNNVSPSSDTLAVLVDTTLPTVSVSKTGPTTGSVTITPSCSDTGGSGLYSCSPGSYATQTTGTHTFTATDKAGNSKSASTTITSQTQYYYADKYLDFDGSNDYLKTTTKGAYGIYRDDGGTFAFEMGFVLDSKSSNFYFFDAAENDGDPRFALWYRENSSKVALYSKYTGKTGIDYEFNFNPSTGVYYAIRLEGGSDADRGYSLYVNNTYIGKSGTAYRFSPTNQYTSIGSRYNQQDFIDGKIYYFRFKGKRQGTGDVNKYYKGTDLTSGSYWYASGDTSDYYRFTRYGATFKNPNSGWTSSKYGTWINESYFRSRSTRKIYQ